MRFRFTTLCLLAALHPPLAARPPEDYFVTQYRSYANVRGSDGNIHCGPATLAMVALAYHQLPAELDGRDRQALMDWCRAAMTEGSEAHPEGMRASQLMQGAARLGLQTRLLHSLDELDSELDQGRLVAVAGSVLRLELPCRGHGGHCMLAVARDSEGYRINDPGGFFRQPGAPLTRQQMQNYLWYGIAFWK